jgi:hypothetical protein
VHIAVALDADVGSEHEVLKIGFEFAGGLCVGRVGGCVPLRLDVWLRRPPSKPRGDRQRVVGGLGAVVVVGNMLGLDVLHDALPLGTSNLVGGDACRRFGPCVSLVLPWWWA